MAPPLLRLRGGRADAPPLRFAPLVMRDKVFAYRAHNPYLLKGFRQNHDTSLGSALLRFHAQTFNIWSHLAGTFAFVVPHLFVPEVAGYPSLTALIRLHALCACACGIASGAFHICESWPTRIYSKLLALDYTMAYVATVSHALLITAYALRGQPGAYSLPLLLLLLVFGVRGTLFFLGEQSASNTTDKASTPATVMGRPLLFLLPIVVHAFCFDAALRDVLLRWALAFACAAGAWLLKLPECLFPAGVFDYLGNSHNVMHVGVLIVYLELHCGIEGLLRAEGAAPA